MGCGTSSHRIINVSPVPNDYGPHSKSDLQSFGSEVKMPSEDHSENEKNSMNIAVPHRQDTIMTESELGDNPYAPEFGEAEGYDNSLTAQAIRLGYPPPTPPAKRKDEIFKAEDYAQVDKFASKVPSDMLYKSFEELAEYLTKDLGTDLEKVRSLFIFTTSIDIKKMQEHLEELPEPGTPLDYLLKIHWQMGNHANFFTQLCRSAGIPCLVLTGVNKSAAYQLGQPIHNEEMSAQWNAILIDGQWRLVDVYWASTCVVGKQSSDWALVDEDGQAVDVTHDEDEGETMHQVNEFFFLTDPDMLICTHLPAEDDWQLMEEPLSDSDFERMVYIRERFHQTGMTFLPVSQRMCNLITKNGQCTISFGIPSNYGKHLQFRYLLFKSRQGTEILPSVPFERYVFYQKLDNAITYHIQFPVKGKFKMDVFGQVDNVHDTLDLVCSYLIECNDPLSSVQPLPDLPDIGWGPGPEAEEVGLSVVTHKEAIIETDDGQIEIQFTMEEARAFFQDLKHNDLEEWLLNRHALIREQDGQLIVNLRLKKKGEYALNLFADQADKEGNMDNVCNYLIKCSKDNENLKPFPRVHNGKLGKGLLADELGVKPVSHASDDLIEIQDGHVEVSFEASKDMELLCELHHNDVDRVMLAEGVQKSTSGKVTTFSMQLPTDGEYALNVYAKSQSQSGCLHHVHSYQIATQLGCKDRSEVLPPKKAVPIIPLYTSEDHAEVRLPVGSYPLVAEFQRKNALDNLDSDKLSSMRDGKSELFQVRMPQMGEYYLDVYEERPNKALVHRCTVHVVRHEMEEGDIATARTQSTVEEGEEEVRKKSPSPEELEQQRKQRELESLHRSLRDKLKAAIVSEDPKLLQKAIRDFESNGVPDENDELTKAKHILSYLIASQALTQAMTKRDLTSLERALAAAEASKLSRKLNLQMQMARQIIEQLRRIEKLRHEIMNLDQKTIAELKSYSKPPEVVHQVMAGCFLLLGSSGKALKQWKQVQIMIGKTGKDSLKRRVSEFKVEDLKIEVALKAKLIFQEYQLDDVRDVSAGAATFYVWSMGMIEECESRFIQDGGDLASVHVSRPRTNRKKHRNSRAI